MALVLMQGLNNAIDMPAFTYIYIAVVAALMLIRIPAASAPKPMKDVWLEVGDGWRRRRLGVCWGSAWFGRRLKVIEPALVR